MTRTSKSMHHVADRFNIINPQNQSSCSLAQSHHQYPITPRSTSHTNGKACVQIFPVRPTYQYPSIPSANSTASTRTRKAFSPPDRGARARRARFHCANFLAFHPTHLPGGSPQIASTAVHSLIIKPGFMDQDLASGSKASFNIDACCFKFAIDYVGARRHVSAISSRPKTRSPSQSPIAIRPWPAAPQPSTPFARCPRSPSCSRTRRLRRARLAPRPRLPFRSGPTAARERAGVGHPRCRGYRCDG